MVKLLRNDITDSKSLMPSDFEPELGKRIYDIIHLENEEVVLVKEYCWGDFFYTFFDMKTMDPISREERYHTEHGREFIEEIPEQGLRFVSVVSVDKDSGLENLVGTVYKNDMVVFESNVERYCDVQTTLKEDYFADLDIEQHHKNSTSNFLTHFYSGDVAEKTKILWSHFKNTWRSALEMGSSNPELFLSDELFLELDKDPLFRTSLLEALKKQEAISTISAQKVYHKIIDHYSIE